MTDQVESYRFANIRIEYMDGSSKVLTGINKLTLSKEHAELLSETGED